jgi:hypothetical protein
MDAALLVLTARYGIPVTDGELPTPWTPELVIELGRFEQLVFEIARYDLKKIDATDRSLRGMFQSALRAERRGRFHRALTRLAKLNLDGRFLVEAMDRGKRAGFEELRAAS